MLKDVMRELVSSARDNQDAGPRNIGPDFLSISVQMCILVGFHTRLMPFELTISLPVTFSPGW